MKRWLSLLLTVFLLVATLSGCDKEKLDNESYAKRYDRILYDLEYILDQHFYTSLRGFFDLNNFNQSYDHQTQRHNMDNLIRTMDDVLYELDLLGHQTDDSTIQTYQSKIEYALKDMRSISANFTRIDVMNELVPNKNTLYREVYFYMTSINDAMLQFTMYDGLLDVYLSAYRDGENYEGLAEMKQKNRLRYTYTYMMTATYIAPMYDYTGLQVDPDRPWFLWSQNVSVYEMSFSVILNFRDYYQAMATIEQGWGQEALQAKVKAFEEALSSTIDMYEVYYKVRSEYPHDFYQSGDFQAFQQEYGNARVGYYYDFKSEYEDLTTMKDAYLELRSMLFNKEMRGLMY